MTYAKPRVPDHVHGTWEGHEQFGCNCAPCAVAWAQFRGIYLYVSTAIDKAYEPIMAETGFADIFDLAIAGRRGA